MVKTLKDLNVTRGWYIYYCEDSDALPSRPYFPRAQLKFEPRAHVFPVNCIEAMTSQTSDHQPTEIQNKSSQNF